MKHAETQIARRLAGQLAPEEIEQFEAHVLECPRCAQEWKESRAVWDALADPEAQRQAERAPSVWQAVRERTVARRQEPWFYGSTAWLRSGLAIGVVAAGLICAVLMPLGGQSTAQAEDSDIDTMWMQNSSWNAASSDQNLDTLWLNAGLETEG